MSDPRFTDPRYSNSQLSDPVGRRDDNVGGVWGWVAGIAVIALIAFFLIAGGKNVNDNTASNSPGASTPPAASTMPRGPAPSTTGMGAPTQTPPPTAPSNR
jgi:hypothetical protein